MQSTDDCHELPLFLESFHYFQNLLQNLELIVVKSHLQILELVLLLVQNIFYVDGFSTPSVLGQMDPKNCLLFHRV